MSGFNCNGGDGMISFDEAVRLIEAAARPLGKESVAIGAAAGRILAAPVIATVDSPPADSSAMDGYAVRDADLPGTLRIIGESFPGQGFEGALDVGTCVRIFTGAPVPRDAERVVIQEVVVRDKDHATIVEMPGKARHIRPCGSDFRSGEVLLEAGRLLDPRAVVAAAGADLAAVEVLRQPGIVILATGDELASPGEARARRGAIPESVSFGIAALAAQYGGRILGSRRLADDLAAMERAAGEAVEQADLVVVTGGASVGERDFAKAMFEAHGLELVFEKVAIKPGKPVWLGCVGRTLVMGLPGNPTSAMVTGRLLLAPLISGLAGRGTALNWRYLRLGAPLPACGERETFHRARLQGSEAVPLTNQDSSAQKALSEANLLVRSRPHDPARSVPHEVQVLDF
jgi:molybdopterin molybdotransferase